MKLKFPLIAAFVAVLSLSACGGGGSGGNSSGVVAENPAQFTQIEKTTGTGAVATAGKNVTVTYTGWLYTTKTADNKGAQFDSGSFTFLLGAGKVIAGFDQGIVGMRVGGQRTLIIPASLGYGASGSGSIPPNAGLVFDVTVTAVQ